ncbi:MAG: Crp/Fnr family transcriptional regulator [Hyphomicrobiaceae bacterium]
MCRELTDADTQRLRQIEFRRVVAHGTTIIGEGDPSTQFATIVSGVVKLTKRLGDGRQQIVAFLFPSDFVGRPFAACCPYSAEAIGEVTLYCYRRDAFEALLRGAPSVEHNLFSLVLSELDAAQDWMLLLGRKTARERVASLLLLFARRVPDAASQALATAAENLHFELPLSRAEMADCLGLRVETVSRQLAALAASGAIGLEGRHRIRVPRLDVLRAAAESERTGGA